VTTTGTAGSSGAKTVITVAASAPTLYYQCSSHSGMGGQVNTNSTFGSSNFSGSIQSTVSAGSTQGFSVVKWTGTGSNATIGHGGASAPTFIMTKALGTTSSWWVYHQSIHSSNTDGYLKINSNAGTADDATIWTTTAPTSSVFSTGSAISAHDHIAYCFTPKQGHLATGQYKGNGNANGTFVYTGFKPAFIMIKRTDATGDWGIFDNKREGYNDETNRLKPNGNDAEEDDNFMDILSNGFKLRLTSSSINASGGTFIYMAFAESPLVNSKGVPNNAK